MLANDQHHDRHANGHAERQGIARQMSIGYRAANHDADAHHRDKAGGESGPRFRQAKPRPTDTAVRNGAAAKITATSATDVLRRALR